MIDSLTTGMETHCVGRHLIDMPKTFKPMDGNAVTLYYGKDKNYETVEVKILREGTSEGAFEFLVQSEADKIAKQVRDDYKTSMLISNTKLSDTAYLLRSYLSGSQDGYFTSQLLVLFGHSATKIEEETYQTSVEVTEARLKTIASQIRSFTDLEEAGRGFCMGHIVIDGDHDFEQAYDLKFFSDQWKDIWFAVGPDSLGSGDEGLLKRLKDNEFSFKAMTNGAASPQFHSGKIIMGNMQGEEALAQLNDYGKLGFSFVAESLTAKKVALGLKSRR